MEDNAPAGPPPEEPDAHVVSRHLQKALRVLLILFGCATVVCLLFFRQVAYLAAIPLPLLYAVLIGVNYQERRSRVSALRESPEGKPTSEELKVDEQVVGLATALKIGGTLAVTALIVAATFFEWELVGIVAAGFFFYMVLLGFPYWLAAVQESEEAEHEKTTGHSRRL